MRPDQKYLLGNVFLFATIAAVAVSFCFYMHFNNTPQIAGASPDSGSAARGIILRSPPASVPAPATSANHQDISTRLEVPTLATIKSAIAYFWWRESRCGQDPNSKPGMVGPAGEQGEYQLTPIFIQDVWNRWQYPVNPLDNRSCIIAITLWLSHYGRLADVKTPDEYYKLYNLGYKGYMETLR